MCDIECEISLVGRRENSYGIVCCVYILGTRSEIPIKVCYGKFVKPTSNMSTSYENPQTLPKSTALGLITRRIPRISQTPPRPPVMMEGIHLNDIYRRWSGRCLEGVGVRQMRIASLCVYVCIGDRPR